MVMMAKICIEIRAALCLAAVENRKIEDFRAKMSMERPALMTQILEQLRLEDEWAISRKN